MSRGQVSIESSRISQGSGEAFEFWRPTKTEVVLDYTILYFLCFFGIILCSCPTPTTRICFSEGVETTKLYIVEEWVTLLRGIICLGSSFLGPFPCLPKTSVKYVECHTHRSCCHRAIDTQARPVKPLVWAAILREAQLVAVTNLESLEGNTSIFGEVQNYIILYWVLGFYDLYDTYVKIVYQWIGLRENLQETMVFTIKYRGFL